MENLESAFDRPRPFAGALRLGACVAIAVALVLLGRTIAPDSSPRSSHSASTTAKTAPETTFDQSPAPRNEPLPGYDDYHLDEARPSVPGDWCSDSGGGEPTQPASSWETSRLASGNGTYTLRHPAGWRVAEAADGAYEITPPDDKMLVVVMFSSAGGLTAGNIVARGGEFLREFGPQLEVERSEKTTLAGTPGCRLIGPPPEVGQGPADYVWAILGDDVVAAGIFTEMSVPAGEKEIARRVLHSLRPEASQA